MSYYLKCSKCGKVVSSVIPGGVEQVMIRAWIECPECIAAVPDVEQRIAAAVAAEREGCAERADEIARTFLAGAELLSDRRASTHAELEGAAAGYVAQQIRARGGKE